MPAFYFAFSHLLLELKKDTNPSMPGARAIATFIAVALLVHRGTFFTAATHDDLRSSKYRCQTFVECENGFVQGEGTYTQEDEEDPTSFAGDARAVTCHDRCAELGGNCCVGEQDCGACVATGGGATGGTTCYGGFTGKVCADDGQNLHLDTEEAEA